MTFHALFGILDRLAGWKVLTKTTAVSFFCHYFEKSDPQTPLSFKTKSSIAKLYSKNQNKGLLYFTNVKHIS